jgi:alpha-L-rhamnosidase
VSEVRRHQNYLAILFGLADERRTASILERVLHNTDIPPLTTPFHKFFEYDVLCRCGFTQEAFDAMRHYYGGMLALGATAIWEDFDEREEGLAHYAMYGDPFDRSLCHAWGAGPLYFTGRYQAGVAPLSPGWREYTVTPCLTMGDFSATVPIGDGRVTVTLAGCRLTVSADRPGGTLTVNGETRPIPAGQPVTVTV